MIRREPKPKADTYKATEPPGPPYGTVIDDPPGEEPRKYFFDVGQVQVATHLV